MSEIEKLLETAEGSREEILEQLDALATACEEKLGIPKTDVFNKFQAEHSRLSKALSTQDADTIARRTFVAIKGFFGQELRSPALIFNGLTLGVSEPFDMVRTARREATEAWQENSEQAIAEGLCNTEGFPLDTKAEFSNGRPNPNFGKPLPDHSWIRNVIGILEHEGEMKLFRMPLGDRHIDVNVLGMRPYTFRANPAKTQKDPSVLSLNPYSRIEFTEIGEDVSELLKDNTSLYESHRMELADIQSYHGRVAGDVQRFCIIEADLMYIDPQPNPNTGNRMVVLSDESLALDHPGITGWIPQSVPVDFGSGSRVIVCAQTQETSFGADEGINYILNITGVYAIPELKVPADEVPQSAVRQVR